VDEDNVGLGRIGFPAMNPSSGVSFEPQTLATLRTILDEAWNSLSTAQKADITKSDLATCVLNLSAQGECDPVRLRQRAVELVVGPPGSKLRSGKNIRAFESHLMEAIRSAFHQACRSLSLSEKDDAITEIVAEKIIELASAGETDPNRLCSQALSAFSSGGATCEANSPKGS
jgi:hypothetical protein